MTTPGIARATFTVVRQTPFWVVEHGGTQVDSFKTREEAMAFATRRANASQNAGVPAQIRFADEPTLIRH
jgi:hypothetical protein